MGVFSRRRHRTDPRTADVPSAREARAETTTHFREFVRTRVGVEAYIEPPTAHDPVTVVLVARTGEWTRRRAPDHKAARALARELAIPAYDVQLTGYPASMRQWNSANRGPR